MQSNFSTNQGNKQRRIMKSRSKNKKNRGLSWGDSILTASHIIYRLPTPIPQSKSPYECLIKKVSNYIYLKVFGCLPFASHQEIIVDKFKSREVLCIFLWCFNAQKEYGLLNMFIITSLSRGTLNFWSMHFFSSQQRVKLYAPYSNSYLSS